MNLELPEGVCDSHVHVGRFPKIHTTFNFTDFETFLMRYKLGSVLVSASLELMRDITIDLINWYQYSKGIYILVRDVTPVELTKFMEFPNVVGLKVNPSQEKKRITDSFFAPYLRILNEHEAILLLHCGRWQYMSSWQFGLEVSRQYPDIKCIFAHMGGTHVDLALPCIDTIKKDKNIYLDTSQARQPIILKYAIEKLGAKRILFGSDTPWGNYLSNLVMLLDLDLKESELNNILRENFINLVGVEKVVPLP